MINQRIKDMMRRDTYFKERMEELGYIESPIAAVIDWEQEALYTSKDRYAFDTLDPEYLHLLYEIKPSSHAKRTPMSERSVAFANATVKNAPNIPCKTSTNEIFRQIFLYEMLLMSALEDHLEMSEDEKLHLVGSNQLTQGVTHMSHQLSKKIAAHQREDAVIGQEMIR